MSSTGRKRRKRGEVHDGKRQELEHYPTPKWASRLLVRELDALFGISFVGKHVLECTAGDGAIVSVLREAGAQVDAVEIDPQRSEIIRASGDASTVITADFLAPTTGSPDLYPWYDAVVTNPPYSEVLPDQPFPRDLAREVVDKSLTMAPLVCMLLRLNWAGSQRRYEWHRAHPAHLIIMSNRPRYVGKKGDSTEYAWWVWREGITQGTYSVAFSDEAPKPKRSPQMKLFT